ncbi:MAG: glycosyltransferase family 2 protein [bacterium]|nr:glycosyltransferase family 2 protein [bacterium]
MFISGFTIARNVVKADYPIREAIYSILPLCDEVIVAVGKSEDSTLEFIKSFNEPKIKIIETIWDDALREGGKVLAIETDKAKQAINPRADWCLYIQADECLDDRTRDNLKIQLEKYQNDSNVEGLLFDYTHFFGSYNYRGDSRNWYRHEIRVVKNWASIHSYKDAQGFRIDGRKLKVKKANATIFHYGWVKNPELQLEKLKQARKLWHSDEFLEKEYENMQVYDFDQVDSLEKYNGHHPEVMKARIAAQNWNFRFDTSKKNMPFKKKLLYKIEKLTGIRIGEYKNYKLL